ncbi:SUMF1/EgtB/PvdO family nonheme iron enzyme [Nocardia sp. BMG51109]|uniref:SUMF1/EgtB/PvdO family nonheme iron enzyme n=1 Tax=Nocardia sp. BMG51109 TaxID=1056816 RepID=UPI0004B9DE90|nr:SUMF1/EgtB/PvdO family nonheme iron enzyme [Nocardia sp. BMG51109]
MVGLIRPWTGAETRALRDARRMSLRQFAAHLGVNERLVSKWEAGGDEITPRPVNQEALDTSLARLTADESARFTELVPPEAIGNDRDIDAFSQPPRTRHPVDGKWIIWIPEGVYLSGPQDKPEWVPGFWIDTFPVTNRDYSRFVAATGYTPPRHWPDGCPPPEIDEHPVVWVTHDDATIYAQWAHKRLPDSLEWEKAARGTRGNMYPWGNQATPAKCNVRGSGPGKTTPVDNYKSGVSPFGAFDMCGNVWEWQASETTGGRYELKGSAFTSPFDRAAPAAHNDADHTMCDDDTGFRCATFDLNE